MVSKRLRAALTISESADPHSRGFLERRFTWARYDAFTLAIIATSGETMFFLLRCVFWLGLVFWHLDWNAGTAPAEPTRTASATATRAQKARADAPRPNSFTPMLQDLARQASAKAQDWCATHTSDCIGAIISATSAAESFDSLKTAPAPALAPTPVARPRGGAASGAAG